MDIISHNWIYSKIPFSGHSFVTFTPKMNYLFSWKTRANINVFLNYLYICKLKGLCHFWDAYNFFIFISHYWCRIDLLMCSIRISILTSFLRFSCVSNNNIKIETSLKVSNWDIFEFWNKIFFLNSMDYGNLN